MTTPGDSFEYTDDSVVARVSFDIPGQSLNDIGQLTQAMGAMRTQLESIARAQSDWLDYLTQVPEITEKANQVLREQITLLERMSYIQNEIGGGPVVGGGAGYGYGSGAPGYGYPGGYSTAAPMGYAQPWMAGTPGMGMGGFGGSAEAAGARREQIEGEDPRLAANMESARGRAVNPALLGTLGAGIATVMGKMKGGGKDNRSASQSPQNNSNRDSSAAADPDKGGMPQTADDPNTPGEPHETDTWVNKASYYLGRGQELANEMGANKAGRIGKILANAGKAMGAGSRILGGGGDDGGGGGGLLGMAGDIWKRLPPTAKITSGVGAGLLAFDKIQDLGEKYTQFQQLGSVQGGDAMTGMKYEAQARIMALNPFITTQQARQAMQMALKEGFRGDNYDTVQDFMIQNFKDLGISMGQSMEMMKAQAIGLSEGDNQSGIKKDLTETLNTMKELSHEGGASFPKRAEQLQDLSAELASKGYSPESINRGAIGLQEGYGDSLALRDSISGIAAQVANSDMLNTLVGEKVGITGHMPGVMGKALNAAGYDNDEIFEMAASEIASQVSGAGGEKFDRVQMFMETMAAYGVKMDFVQAEALYDKVTGEEKPTVRANRKVSRQGKTQSGTGWGGFPGSGDRTSSNPADADWNAAHGNYSPSENAAGVADSFAGAGRGGGSFAPSGNAAAPLPQDASMVSRTVNTQGTVTGTVTITVDQQGRVSAPAAIQLTGQQKSALAGFGSATMNNAPPGDPTFNHAFNSFPPPNGGNY